MTTRQLASQIAEASAAADVHLAAYLADPAADETALAEALRQYIAVKQQLLPEEIGDNITIMVRISISRASGISLDKLKEMDRPGACGSAPAVLAKRVLLFLDIQKKLDITLPPDKLYGVQTVRDLAGLAYPLLKRPDSSAGSGMKRSDSSAGSELKRPDSHMESERS